MSTRPMVSVALEANRKRFPWVKINIFFKKMVKADWGGEKKKNRWGNERNTGGMWRRGHETMEWDEDRKTEKERRQAEREGE